MKTPQRRRRQHALPPLETRLTCRAMTHSGQPCEASPQPSGWCFTHDPARSAERDAARRKGGRRGYSKGTPVQVSSIDDIRLGLCDVVGRLNAQDNTVAVARALVGAYGELRATLSAGELEQRLAALERAMAEQQGVPAGADSVFRPAQKPAESEAGDPSETR